MSSISLLSAYAGSQSLVDFLNESDNSTTASNDYTGTMQNITGNLTSSLKNVASSYTSTSDYLSKSSLYDETTTAALVQALSEIKPNRNGMVTFGMVEDYKDQLESDLTVYIKAGLLAAGIDSEAEFSLVAKNGEMNVVCSDPGLKKELEMFFDAYPAISKEFLYAQALGNVSRGQSTVGAASESGFSVNSLSSELDQFLNSLSSSGQGFSSLFASFSSNDMVSYTLGSNYKV